MIYQFQLSNGAFKKCYKNIRMHKNVEISYMKKYLKIMNFFLTLVFEFFKTFSYKVKTKHKMTKNMDYFLLD